MRGITFLQATVINLYDKTVDNVKIDAAVVINSSNNVDVDI